MKLHLSVPTLTGKVADWEKQIERLIKDSLLRSVRNIMRLLLEQTLLSSGQGSDPCSAHFLFLPMSAHAPDLASACAHPGPG
jgi:hypothetical protein